MNFSNFIVEDGVYCQKDFDSGKFEKEYVMLRAKEGRIHNDEVVKSLPFIKNNEWSVRAWSAKRLVKQLKKENTRSVIEIGCGNGWLSNYIERQLNIPVVGIDVSKMELKQAARLSTGNTKFIYGDIFSPALRDLNADAIVLAACVQYFPDLNKLIDRLNGIIHIIDSPFYKPTEAAAARERSKKYFESKDASGMEQFYFHHTVIKDAEFLYRPTLLSRYRGGSPFPWIRIRKGR